MGVLTSLMVIISGTSKHQIIHLTYVQFCSVIPLLCWKETQEREVQCQAWKSGVINICGASAHTPTRYLLNIYCVPGIVPDAFAYIAELDTPSSP